MAHNPNTVPGLRPLTGIRVSLTVFALVATGTWSSSLRPLTGIRVSLTPILDRNRWHSPARLRPLTGIRVSLTFGLGQVQGGQVQVSVPLRGFVFL